MNALTALDKAGLPPLWTSFEPEKLQIEAAAVLLAEDRLTDSAIAREVNVSASTLREWKKRPEIVERIRWHRDQMMQHARGIGIAVRERRLSAIQDRWQRAHALLYARAQHYANDPEAKEIGGDTGLLVRQVKISPKGDKIVEYAFDAALYKELRELEKHASIELGQHVEKTANLNMNVNADAADLTDDQHEAIRAFLTGQETKQDDNS